MEMDILKQLTHMFFNRKQGHIQLIIHYQLKIIVLQMIPILFEIRKLSFLRILKGQMEHSLKKINEYSMAFQLILIETQWSKVSKQIDLQISQDLQEIKKLICQTSIKSLQELNQQLKFLMFQEQLDLTWVIWKIHLKKRKICYLWACKKKT